MRDDSEGRLAIEAACDAFEDALRSGGSPSVLDALSSVEQPLWDRLAPELFFLEIDHARRNGEPADLATYKRRYPTLLKHLEVAFATLAPDEDATSDGAARLPELRSGSTIGRYQLTHRLGQGARCVVWQATDTIADRTVALKLPDWPACSIDERLRFLREGRTLAKLSHTGIVKLHEQYRDGTLPYLSLEHIDGGTLADCLTGGPLSAKEAASICCRLAESLSHAHSQGVIHRDIKPANVLLASRDRPVLIDFGLSRDLLQGAFLTECGDVVGTLAYMPPEQADGRAAEADQRSDVYGVGAVLYECLTGQRLYDGDAATIIRSLTDPARRPVAPRRLQRRVPRELELICLKAIADHRDDRYRSADELASDLRRLLAGKPVALSRFGAVRRRLRVGRKSAAPIAAVAALVVAAAAIWPARSDERRGTRAVEVSTVPAGARVAFVPLGERGDRPQPERAIFGRGPNPIRVSLPADRYLVIAALPDGRFHEVYRNVPSADDNEVREGIATTFKTLPGGALQLAPVSIPPASVIDSMVLVDGHKNYRTGFPDSTEFPTSGVIVRPFYMDPTEFGVTDTDDPGVQLPLPIGVAWTGSYYAAAAMAERHGKRLPTEIEYEYAATSCGRHRFPWGDEFPTPDGSFSSEAAAPAPFDLCPIGPGILGLATGVSEWAAPTGTSDPARLPGFKVARGGSRETIDGSRVVTAASSDPRNRHYLLARSTRPGVGFRGVRSHRPLIAYDEME